MTETNNNNDNFNVQSECSTYFARIYIAGPKHKAEDICRKWVEKGGCVNISETNYIFTHGEQTGLIIEFINYPRFPRSPDEILEMATDLAQKLLHGMHQGSYTIQTPRRTYLYDRRKNQ